MYEQEQAEQKRRAKQRTDRVCAELVRRGIDPPRGHGMWWDDMEEHGGTIDEIEAATNFYLTEKGEAAGKD